MVATVVPRGAIDLRGVARNRPPLEIAVGLRHLHLGWHLHELVGRAERTPARALWTDRARRQRRRGDVERGSEARKWIVVRERRGGASLCGHGHAVTRAPRVGQRGGPDRGPPPAAGRGTPPAGGLGRG